MKTSLAVILSILFVGLTINAKAATVSFVPNPVTLQIAPGATATETFRINLVEGGASTVAVDVGSQVGGTLPAHWLTPVLLQLTAGTGGTDTATMTLRIAVPDGTPAGTYNGLVMPMALGSREPLTSGGLQVTVNVGSLQKCDSPPVFRNTEITPRDIWAPSDRTVELGISGEILVAPGCEVKATYGMESNTGFVQGNLALDDDNSFHQLISVNISRSGTDKQGKIYQGMLTAIDGDDHETVQRFSVTVAHDRGNKEEQKK